MRLDKTSKIVTLPRSEVSYSIWNQVVYVVIRQSKHVGLSPFRIQNNIHDEVYKIYNKIYRQRLRHDQ